MSDQGALSSQQVSPLPVCAAKEPPHDNTEEDSGIRDGGQEVEERKVVEEEEEMTSSAHLEPSTLPWPGDKDKEESRCRWRESLPEGERWREEVEEALCEGQAGGGAGGSLADDEDEGDEEEEEKEKWVSAPGFTPEVTIVRPSCKVQPEERQPFLPSDGKKPEWGTPSLQLSYRQYVEEHDDKYYLCEGLCAVRIRVLLATAAAGVVFPLLVWAGYALLPFDAPLLQSAPLRVVYTLRCAFFAAIPILLGMLVLGLARLRHGNMGALYAGERVDRDVAVHWHFVSQSLSLLAVFFLQLAVMASYVHQDLVKLVPLITICFSLGMLVYWLCLFLGSTSIRAFGFGLSFHPILVMLCVNLYYVCSSLGPGAVFDVAPPTTVPAPAARNWWG